MQQKPPSSSNPSDAPQPSVRARLLESLRGPERYTLFAADVARAFEVDVDAARAALRAIVDPAAWQAGGYAGSRVLFFPGLAEHGTMIADLPVGMHIPRHAHGQRELTFVLDGELRDDAARSFGPGELLEMHTGSQHAITVVGTHACLAVFRGEPR